MQSTLVPVKVRYSDALWLLLLGACTFEPDGTNAFSPEVGDTSSSATTSPAGETGDDTDASSSSTTTTTTTSVADSSGADSSSVGTDTNPTTGTTDETSGTSGAVCGNGVPDDGEECDDGNDDEFDECSSECTVPVCDDGQHNGGETDVDCGGSCQACALCQTCQDASDCEGAMACSSQSQCVTQFDVSVDWSDNCGTSAQGVTIDALAAGTYRATASQSAGTLWLPGHNPPTTGYFYLAECTGVTFEEMRTPPGIRYINTNTAFSNMESETETFEYGGGDFTCWITDATCGDNNGGVDFSVESVCER